MNLKMEVASRKKAKEDVEKTVLFYSIPFICARGFLSVL